MSLLGGLLPLIELHLLALKVGEYLLLLLLDLLGDHPHIQHMLLPVETAATPLHVLWRRVLLLAGGGGVVALNK